MGTKAILVTRLDEAAKTHDLLAVYGELPDDRRSRPEGDFPEIADVLGHTRETFGRWRHFEQGVGEEAIRALVDTDRSWVLGKSAGRHENGAADPPVAGGRRVVSRVGRVAASRNGRRTERASRVDV